MKNKMKRKIIIGIVCATMLVPTVANAANYLQYGIHKFNASQHCGWASYDHKTVYVTLKKGGQTATGGGFGYGETPILTGKYTPTVSAHI